ncbi:MAG: RAD55 family ATPase [Candidatus Freyarchaeota archaeon]
MMMSDRVPTGIKELDKLIEGGFLRYSMVLFSGSPGAGKTILSATFIHEGATKYKESGVYVCFAESKGEFIRDMQKFGVDFESLTRKDLVSVLDLSLTTETDVQSALNQILEAITSIRAKRLVVDSITAMSVGQKEELEKRHLIRLLYKLIKKTGCTAIIIADMPWGTSRIGGGIEEFIADGIILMESNYTDEGVLRRQLRIIKMRGTNHTQKTHEYKIGKNGIEVKI